MKPFFIHSPSLVRNHPATFNTGTAPTPLFPHSVVACVCVCKPKDHGGVWRAWHGNKRASSIVFPNSEAKKEINFCTARSIPTNTPRPHHPSTQSTAAATRGILHLQCTRSRGQTMHAYVHLVLSSCGHSLASEGKQAHRQTHRHEEKKNIS